MVEFYTRPLAVVGISALSFSIWARHPTEWTVSRVQVAFAEKCWLYPTWTCLLAFTLSRGPGVCHSGASCSWRADDMVRSWKSTDQSENGLAGSDNWISGFQDFKTLAQFQSGRSLLRGAAVCSQDILYVLQHI